MIKNELTENDIQYSFQATIVKSIENRQWALDKDQSK